jgi:hypothetical protein
MSTGLLAPVSIIAPPHAAGATDHVRQASSKKMAKFVYKAEYDWMRPNELKRSDAVIWILANRTISTTTFVWNAAAQE